MARESSSADVDFEANVNKKLQSLNDRQDSIQTMSLWVIHHKGHCTQIAAAWMTAMKKAIPAKKRLTLFYLLNDVLQNCKRKNAKIYLLAFKPFLKDAILCVRTPDIRPKVERILSIWEERGVFTRDYTNELKDVLIRGDEQESRDSVTDQLIDNFKPGEFSAAITELKRYEDEVALMHKQLLQVHLDATSAEATKALKDRTNSKQFAMQFEESCVKMEEYVAALQKEIKDRTQFIEQLEQAQLFYETQWNESQVVVKAYKNFGIRVKNLKKRLDEYTESRPDDEAASSPVPLSAVADAPSPGDTPPLDPSQDNVESIDMDLSDEETGTATGSIVSVSPVKARAATADVSSASGVRPPASLQPSVGGATERPPLGGTLGSRLPGGTAAQPVPASAGASAPTVSPVALSKPAVYDPRQAYNPAYHLQPKPTVPVVAAASAALAVAAPAPAAAVVLAVTLGNQVPLQAEVSSVQLSKALGTLGGGGRPVPTGVLPPLPVQPPQPPAATAAASALSAAAAPAGSSSSAGAANPGIELLRKLINQAGASPSQNTSVLESLTSFAQTVKSLTASKKDDGVAATPATWSDWKKKQLEQDDEEEEAGGSAAAAAAASAMGSTLLQPQRPMPPQLLPDRVAAGTGQYLSLPGTFLPRLSSFPTAVDASKLATPPSGGGVAPLAPPPPLPSLLSNRMANATMPGASGPVAVSAGAVPPLLAGLPQLLPPLPPAGMHAPPFDVSTLLPPVFPFERQPLLPARYAPPLPPMLPLHEFDKGSTLNPLMERVLVSPPPAATVPSQAAAAMPAASARSPLPLAAAAASPAVQAVLAKLKLPISGSRPASASGEDPTRIAMATIDALGLAAPSEAAAPLSAAPATFHFSAEPSSPLSGAGAHGGGLPRSTPASAISVQQPATGVPTSAVAAMPNAAALPPAIMAVLTSGLSRSKEAAATAAASGNALSAAASLLLPSRAALSAEPLADDGRQQVPPMDATSADAPASVDAPGSSRSGSSPDSASGGSSSSPAVTAESSAPPADAGRRAAAARDGLSPEPTSPTGDAVPLPDAASEPVAETASAGIGGGSSSAGDVGAGPPAAATSAGRAAEEFYPIQSLASMRKPDHFDRRPGGGQFRRDHRRGMLAFGGGGSGGSEPLPPGMADYYGGGPHGVFGADPFVGGGRAGHRYSGPGPRRNHDHGRGSLPYSFHPY